MSTPTRIYLTGFMGSGKSTLGPMVANVLGYEFVDMDVLLENEFGCTIAEVFRRNGEAAFREAESRLVRETANREETVVAVGGGALARENNLSFALDHGLVVYLRWPAMALARRLVHSTDRPMLFDEKGERLSIEGLVARIQRLLEEREPYYLRAQVCVDLGTRPIGFAVDAVVHAIRRWRPPAGGSARALTGPT